MNYLKTYFDLVNTRKEMKRDVYIEKHHIIPKSVFGYGILDESRLNHFDDPQNLVQLTGREHFIAHWLLHRAFPTNRNFAAAFHAMSTMTNKYHYRYTPSSRAVEEARKAYADLQKLPVAMYNLEGKFLKVFKTTNEAALEIESNVSNISAACNEGNNVNNIKGYQWRRFDKKPKKQIAPYINLNDESRQLVHEYDLKGKYIKTYESIREANRNGIDRSALKKRKRDKPIFVNDKWILFSSSTPLEKIEVKKSGTQRRQVHQIAPNTGQIIKTWKSTREPQRILGIANVSSVCNGKRKTMGGYIWKYAEDDYNLNLSKHKRKLPRATEISIYKYDTLIGIFPSFRKAEESTGIKRKLLSNLLKTQKEIDGIKVLKTINKKQHRNK